MKKFLGQGKVREFQFQLGKFRKNEKVRKFQKFPEKFIFYRLLKSMISINCKRFMVWNITFIIVMVWDVLLYINSAKHKYFTQFFNSGWMRMAIMGRQKGLENDRKSGNFEMEIWWQPWIDWFHQQHRKGKLFYPVIWSVMKMIKTIAIMELYYFIQERQKWKPIGHKLIEPRLEKACLCHMRTTKVQISLRICAVWSAFGFSLLR